MVFNMHDVHFQALSWCFKRRNDFFSRIFCRRYDKSRWTSFSIRFSIHFNQTSFFRFVLCCVFFLFAYEHHIQFVFCERDELNVWTPKTLVWMNVSIDWLPKAYRRFPFSFSVIAFCGYSFHARVYMYFLTFSGHERKVRNQTKCSLSLYCRCRRFLYIFFFAFSLFCSVWTVVGVCIKSTINHSRNRKRRAKSVDAWIFFVHFFFRIFYFILRVCLQQRKKWNLLENICPFSFIFYV